MRGAETVKEMEERHARFQCGGMPDAGHVLRLLHRAGRKHGEPGLPAGHHIGVIAENRKAMGCQRARGHVHAEGEQFARDLVHIGDHQEQALRRGEGGAQRADLQHAVHGPRRAGFRLHFHQPRHGAVEVGAARRRPLIAPFRHGRGRGDGINGDRFDETIGDGGGGFVAVQRGEWDGGGTLGW